MERAKRILPPALERRDQRRRAGARPAPRLAAERVSAIVDGGDAPAPALAAEASPVFADADRLVHAAFAHAGSGVSPVSLLLAWQDWAMHLAMSPGKQLEVQAKAFEKWSRLARFCTACLACGGEAAPCITPLPQDRRFADEAWGKPPFNFWQQSFLLAQQWWHNATVGVPGVSKKHERLVEFYSRQILDMFSPSNFAATNPEVLAKAVQTGGANFAAGFGNLVDDMARAQAGGPPAGAERFKPGVHVAVTPGDVIFRNSMMELIRYQPATAAVRTEPILIVPAWIMKYYILDLSPENSLIRYLVGQGFEVFCISWRNPRAEHRDWSLDDYRTHGVMTALDTVTANAPARKVHAIGYCLGGTLLSIAAAAMARDGDERLQSVTLLASLLDFDEPGEIGLFIDEGQVSMLESLMWTEGFLDQRRMAGAFQMLRSQDLVWSRMVRDYLLGERRPVTDLMAWNADATRMPWRMHSQYLRRLYLDDDLAHGRYRVDGRAIHLEDIRAPVFAVATIADHVAPWRSVFKAVHMLDSDVDFALVNRGHNAGIVSEPGHAGRWFRLLRHRHGEAHPDPDAWLEATPEREGSWWPSWHGWLAAHSTGEIAVGQLPSPPSLGPAPGEYVLET
jgi:polyhydroxyalkanoate synthase